MQRERYREPKRQVEPYKGKDVTSYERPVKEDRRQNLLEMAKKAQALIGELKEQRRQRMERLDNQGIRRSRLAVKIYSEDPKEKVFLKDIIYLLQDFNSLYTRLVLISKGDYTAAIVSPSYRRRFETIGLDEQLAVITIEHGSVALVSLEGLDKPITATQKALEDTITGVFWRWRHDKRMAELEVDKARVEVDKARVEVDKARVELLAKVVSIVKEIGGDNLEKPLQDGLAESLLRDIQRFAENPKRIEVTASSSG